jgi:hypothetical protein
MITTQKEKASIMPSLYNITSLQTFLHPIALLSPLILEHSIVHCLFSLHLSLFLVHYSLPTSLSPAYYQLLDKSYSPSTQVRENGPFPEHGQELCRTFPGVGNKRLGNG